METGLLHLWHLITQQNLLAHIQSLNIFNYLNNSFYVALFSIEDCSLAVLNPNLYNFPFWIKCVSSVEYLKTQLKKSLLYLAFKQFCLFTCFYTYVLPSLCKFRWFYVFGYSSLCFNFTALW